MVFHYFSVFYVNLVSLSFRHFFVVLDLNPITTKEDQEKRFGSYVCSVSNTISCKTHKMMVRMYIVTKENDNATQYLVELDGSNWWY